MGHKRKLEAEIGHDDVECPNVDITRFSKMELVSEPSKRKSKSSQGRYALYLIRKPIEVTPEDLSEANIAIDSSIKKERKITIGGHDCIMRGVDLSAQALHVPASVIHSSEESSSAEAGSVVISRAEFDETDGIFEEGCDDPLSLTQNLPFKKIRKKVSRKGIQHLRQRLTANGVKKLKSDRKSSTKEES